MSLHASITSVLERTKYNETELAIFKAPRPNIFNVLFADTVQTQIDIKRGHDANGYELITVVKPKFVETKLRKLLEETL